MFSDELCISVVSTNMPYRIKMYMEFHLATWLKNAELTGLYISGY